MGDRNLEGRGQESGGLSNMHKGPRRQAQVERGLPDNVSGRPK